MLIGSVRDAVAFAALWFALSFSASKDELLAGLGVVALAIIASRIAWRKTGCELALARIPMRGALRLPLEILIDTWRTLAAAFASASNRHVRSSQSARTFARTGRGPASETRRALAIVIGSMTPGTIVFDVDRGQQQINYHRLGNSTLPTWARRLGARQ
jgi:multisubunit Na+/H+ antiporter MnhE subunit